jgi:hypothetical protein
MRSSSLAFEIQCVIVIFEGGKGMKARGRGRPKLSHASSKRSTIAVRLKKKERKAVEEAASRAGMNLSAWVRRVIREATGKKRRQEKSNGFPTAGGIQHL